MNINNKPEELLEFINNNLKFNEKKKNENGEVFTPFSLINEMLDKLPEEVWNDPYLKWLDPAAGIGNFSIIVYTRLMIGLKDFFDTEENMKQWILEEMLYFVEYDETNVNKLKEIFCNDKYNLNLFHGSFVSDEKYKKANIPIYSSNIKFDIIMGNPPYQKNDDMNKRKPLNVNLWSIFLNNSFKNYLKNDGYLVFITPISWMSPAFKNKDIFYNNYIIYLNINECNKWFNVGSQFSYYIIKKTDKKENTIIICKYKNKIYKSFLYINNDMSYLPKLITSESLNIIDKFYNNKIKKISFNLSNELDYFYEKNLLGICNNNNFIYKVRHTTKNTNLCSSIKHSLANKNKILMNTPASLDPIYDNGHLGFTRGQMYFLTDNKEYVNVLNSKLYKFIFQICKWSGFNTLSIFKEIPYIEKYEDDKTMYKLFELTEEEIKFIEEN